MPGCRGRFRPDSTRWPARRSRARSCRRDRRLPWLSGTGWRNTSLEPPSRRRPTGRPRSHRTSAPPPKGARAALAEPPSRLTTCAQPRGLGHAPAVATDARAFHDELDVADHLALGPAVLPRGAGKDGVISGLGLVLVR